MAEENGTKLKALLRQRHWQNYPTFCREYDRSASVIDSSLIGTWPSRAQFHRWLSGALISLPYPHHCRVLEKMFEGWTAVNLFSKWSGEALPSPASEILKEPASAPSGKFGMGGVVAVFSTRSEFAGAIPAHELFDGAKKIRAAGLSLNLVCQQYPVRALRRKIVNGGKGCFLFLNPRGEHIGEREREEGFSSGDLAALTRINMELLLKLRDDLGSHSENLRIGVYDEPLRYNIVIVDDSRCVIQPYLPAMRGVESPTLVAMREVEDGSIFMTFDEVLSSLEDRSSFL
ncbi:DUF5919 domain-containing protein [Frankia gtarii]|uniref:DUF5919 domain-containing protein n=1 Tax=Frankia gtarii TaxID=2950102 RepID=UPI0021C0EEBD|nr:DUF5919 domain-containing protein [Frankia gtarii]